MVLVHLFEWTWNDIACEAQEFLRHAGYSGVQISPPNEHAVAFGHPWWQRYQPVSYRLDRCRSGTRDELVAMVERCRALGIDVYADAVINHMTGEQHLLRPTGSAGSSFSKYEYPGLYDERDFHPDRSWIRPEDYVNDRQRVQTCELEGLSDLDTGAPSVQRKIADYLVSLAKIGVNGFRIDAAKHMAPEDIDAILRLTERALGWRPKTFLEVIDHGGEAVKASDYLGVLDEGVRITEFKYSWHLTEHFSSVHRGARERRLAQLRTLGPSWGLLPSERATVFVDNHDNQRQENLHFADGVAYVLANVFMLAWPYGEPVVMSGYVFDRGTSAGIQQGPPSDARGRTRGPWDGGRFDADRCGRAPEQWVAEHRWPDIAAMVAFRRAVGDEPVTCWWDDGHDRIAFGRGNKGFVAFNLTSQPMTQSLQTGLAPGCYQNVVGMREQVTVDERGVIQAVVPPMSALTLHVGARAARGGG